MDTWRHMTKEDHRGAQSASSLGDDSGEILEDLASLNSLHMSPCSGSPPQHWQVHWWLDFQKDQHYKSALLSVHRVAGPLSIKKICSLLSSWAFSEMGGVNWNRGISWGSRALHERIFTVPDWLYFCVHTRRHMCLTQVLEPSPSRFTVRECCLLIWVLSLTLHLE